MEELSEEIKDKLKVGEFEVEVRKTDNLNSQLSLNS